MPRTKNNNRSVSKKRVNFRRRANTATAGSGAYSVPRRRITGKGSYTENKDMPKRYRGPFDWLGKSLGQWTGWGDYVSPSGNTVLAPEPPQMVRDGDAVVITHREYLGDIISAATPNTFKIEKWGLNPSDNNTFPWLSQIAQPNFQQYKFDQLMFEFRSFSADALNSTNTALGAMFSAINYDYSDPDFQSRQQVENSNWARSCKPSESTLIPVECDPSQTGLNSGLLYVINGNTVPAGADPKTYYLGKIFIGTTGVQGASVNLGSLYVSYRVKLYKPVMSPPASGSLIFVSNRSGCTQVGNVHFGTAEIASIYNSDSIGVTITGTGNVMTLSNQRLQVGQVYYMQLQWTGGSTAAVVPPSIAISSNAVGENYFISYTAPTVGMPNTPTTSSACTLDVCFRVMDVTNNVTITLTGGVLPTAAGVNCGIVLSQICGIQLGQIGKFTP